MFEPYRQLFVVAYSSNLLSMPKCNDKYCWFGHEHLSNRYSCEACGAFLHFNCGCVPGATTRQCWQCRTKSNAASSQDNTPMRRGGRSKGQHISNTTTVTTTSIAEQYHGNNNNSTTILEQQGSKNNNATTTTIEQQGSKSNTLRRDKRKQRPEYEVWLSPHVEFGIGVRFEARNVASASNAIVQGAIAKSFIRHPLSESIMPAEESGMITLGDSLVGVNDLDLSQCSFEEIIDNTKRNIGRANVPLKTSSDNCFKMRTYTI